MMSILQKISFMRAELTNVERKIAAYIIDYPELVLKQNVGQLATAAGSSPATVIRFFKKSEFNNFSQFKILLASDLAANKQYTSDDVAAHDNYEIVRKKMLDNSIESLRQTSDTLTKDSVMKMIEEIHQAKQIYLFGLGASSLVAENIAQKWSRAGIRMTVFQEINLFLPIVETATKDDLIWFISNSGTTPEVVWSAQAAQKRHLQTVSLTKYDANPLADLTNLQLHTAIPIETRMRSAATNSLLSQFLVVDIIYYFYLSQYYNASNKNLTRTHDIIEQYHRDIALIIPD